MHTIVKDIRTHTSKQVNRYYVCTKQRIIIHDRDKDSDRDRYLEESSMTAQIQALTPSRLELAA